MFDCLFVVDCGYFSFMSKPCLLLCCVAGGSGHHFPGGPCNTDNQVAQFDAAAVNAIPVGRAVCQYAAYTQIFSIPFGNHDAGWQPGA